MYMYKKYSIWNFWEQVVGVTLQNASELVSGWKWDEIMGNGQFGEDIIEF